jgi:hypothetical protein
VQIPPVLRIATQPCAEATEGQREAANIASNKVKTGFIKNIFVVEKIKVSF